MGPKAIKIEPFMEETPKKTQDSENRIPQDATISQSPPAVVDVYGVYGNYEARYALAALWQN